MESEDELELALDRLAHEHGLSIIKESNLTGYSYTLLNKDDTWYFLLNHCDYNATRH